MERPPAAFPPGFDPAPVSFAQSKCEFPYFNDRHRGVYIQPGGPPPNPVFIDPGRRDLINAINLEFTLKPGQGKADNKFTYSRRQRDHDRRKRKNDRRVKKHLEDKGVHESTLPELMEVWLRSLGPLARSILRYSWHIILCALIAPGNLLRGLEQVYIFYNVDGPIC
jgi:hypothetical protein